MSNTSYIRAVVIDQVNGSAVGRGPYRNILNTAGSIRNFQAKMKNMFPNASHINYYDSKKVFLYQQKWLSKEQPEKKRKRLSINQLHYAFYFTGQDRNYCDLILSQWDPH